MADKNYKKTKSKNTHVFKMERQFWFKNGQYHVLKISV